MRSFIKSSINSYLLCSLLLVLFACGKKAGNGGGNEVVTPPVIVDDFESYLEKQSISCKENTNCPTYIAKIIVRSGPGSYKACTGFLTDSNTIATSTTCLTPILRLTGQDCSKDVVFFFTKPFAKALRVGCREVVQASENYNTDPTLNRDDVAFLRMDTSLPFRRNLGISRDGIPNNKQVTFIGVAQGDDENGEIKEVDCTTVLNSYVNPLVSSEISPGISLSGCSFLKGFTGAPVLDYKNKMKVRGVVAAAMNPAIRTHLQDTGLLVNGLKDFIHATNFSCAPTIYNTDVADDRECSKDMSDLQIEKLRTNMLSAGNLFGDFKAHLESMLEATKFIRFNVKLNPRANRAEPTKPNYDIMDTEITPKCFKDLNAMGTSKSYTIQNFKEPRRTFKKVMDDTGKVQGIESDPGSKTFNINFSPKDLKKYLVAPIYYWDGPTGKPLKDFQNVPVCP